MSRVLRVEHLVQESRGTAIDRREMHDYDPAAHQAPPDGKSSRARVREVLEHVHSHDGMEPPVEGDALLDIAADDGRAGEAGPSPIDGVIRQIHPVQLERSPEPREQPTVAASDVEHRRAVARVRDVPPHALRHEAVAHPVREGLRCIAVAVRRPTVETGEVPRVVGMTPFASHAWPSEPCAACPFYEALHAWVDAASRIVHLQRIGTLSWGKLYPYLTGGNPIARPERPAAVEEVSQAVALRPATHSTSTEPVVEIAFLSRGHCGKNVALQTDIHANQ